MPQLYAAEVSKVQKSDNVFTLVGSLGEKKFNLKWGIPPLGRWRQGIRGSRSVSAT